jgi:hypothetical protein
MTHDSRLCDLAVGLGAEALHFFLFALTACHGGERNRDRVRNGAGGGSGIGDGVRDGCLIAEKIPIQLMDLTY